MAKSDQSTESHLSEGERGKTPPGPIRQHQQLARGGKLPPANDPYGKSDLSHKVGNSSKTY